jgi:DNA/RNA-binding domain of Phe-tRNA-synthetase-like protein
MGLYRINNVVDVLNLTSIIDGFSISGFTPSRITGNISLGIGKAAEPYKGIGRGDLNITNLPVLRDKEGAFGTPTSDSERTKIGPETNEILFVFYDFGRSPALEGSMENCLALLKKYCHTREKTNEVLNYL